MSFEKNIKPITDDYNQLAKAIYDDLSEITKQIKKNDNQTWRRLYIRSIVTAIESQISYIQSHLKVIRQFDYLPLNENEETHLSGKQRRISFEQRVLFMLNLFSEANYTSLKIDTKSNDWKKFTTLIRVRNRLTHPKSSNDFEVTLNEVKTCEYAFNKFQDTLKILMERSGESLEAQANKLREVLNNMSK